MEGSDFFKFMRQHGMNIPPGMYNAKVQDVSIHLGGDITIEFEVYGGAFDGKKVTMRFRSVEGDDDQMTADADEPWKGV